jgi:hypothetical protein
MWLLSTAVKNFLNILLRPKNVYDNKNIYLLGGGL